MAGPDSALGMLLFVMLGFGSNSRDVVSYINPDDYFASRKVDVKLQTLLDLAAKTPETGKDQVMQLLAIRKLATGGAEVRKDARVRELLTQIAERKKGKDRLGFAEEYARRALAQLDGKPAPAATMPKLSLKADAFAWFPKEATVVAGFDLRPVAGVPAPDVTTLQELVTKFTRKGSPERMFDFIEKVGNVRLDRFSVALAPDPQGGGDGRPNGRLYVRVTGKVDHARVIGFLCDEGKLVVAKQERGPDGEPITYVRDRDRAPVIAMVGDSDLLIAGYLSDRGDHMALLQQMQEARAGKQRSVLAGPLGVRLKKAQPQTFILMVGDITKNLGFGPLGAPGIDGKGTLPKTVAMEVTRKAAGLDVALEAVMANPDDAQRLADEASKALRTAADDMRRELNRKSDVPKDLIDLAAKTVESVKPSAKGTKLSFSLHLSNDVMKAVPDFLGRIGAIPGGPQPEFRKEELKDFKKEQESRVAPEPLRGGSGERAGLLPVASRMTAAAASRPSVTEARRAARLAA